jgi:amino acid adenylation domain-containing protein
MDVVKVSGRGAALRDAPALPAVVHRYFEKCAAANPYAPSIHFGERSFTYRWLEDAASELARALLRRIRPGAAVALHVDRSPEQVVAVLAILKAGAAYVPLDPAYPAERCEFILRESGASLLIVRDATGSLSMQDLGSDGGSSRPGADLRPRPPSDASGERKGGDVAYVLFTSGSTGQPKGVLGHHGGILNRVQWMQQRFPFQDDDVFCLKTSLTFVDSVWDLFQPLMSGRPLVVFPEGAQKDPDAFVHLLARHAVTRLSIVPSHLRGLLDYFPDLGRRLPALRVLDVTGETLTCALARRLCAAFTDATILNRYGTTEAPSVMCFDVRELSEAIHGDYVSLGQPITGSRAFVLDERLWPVSPGEVGELCVAGAQIACGYVNRPEQNALKFGLTPKWLGGPPLPMYRTGDLARVAADGTILCLGRADHQVSIRGHRVELEEVEARLGEHPAIREAAVVAIGPPDQKRLAAVYVTAHNQELAGETFQAYLSRRLPEYMVPAVVVRAEALPLLPSGKVDRKGVEAMVGGALRSEPAVVGGATTEQRILAEVSSVLGRAVAPDQNFLQLGLDSLHAIALTAKLKRSATLSVHDVFTHPTAAALARLLDERAVDPSVRAPLPGLYRSPLASEGPMCFGQRLLWRLDRGLAEQRFVYNDLWPLKLTGRLDARALELALEAIVARHESFRTVYGVRDGREFQRIADLQPVVLPLVDLSSSEAGERVRRMDELLDQERRRAFDIEREQLLRGVLVRRAADEHVLLLSAHHITEDAWSGRLLDQDLSEAYNAIVRRGRLDAAAAPALRCIDFAAWQHQIVNAGHLERSIAFWKEQLAAAPDAGAILDRPHSTPPTFARGGVQVVHIGMRDAERLKMVAKSADTTPFIVFLTGLYAALFRYSGARDIVIGSPVAFRHIPGTEGIVGFFANMLAFRVRTADASPLELVRQVHATALAAYEHQDVPIADIADRMGWRWGSRHPLTDITFYMPGSRPRLGEALTLDGLACERLPMPAACTYPKMDLTIAAVETGDGLDLIAYHNRAVLDDESAQRILRLHADVLRELARDAHLPSGAGPAPREAAPVGALAPARSEDHA